MSIVVWRTATPPPAHPGRAWEQCDASRRFSIFIPFLTRERFFLPGSGRRDTPSFRETSNLEFGAVSLPLDGEEVCGDHWAIKEVGGRTFIMVVDGLGHGLQAAEASREAIRVFQDSPTPEPADIDPGRSRSRFEEHARRGAGHRRVGPRSRGNPIRRSGQYRGFNPRPQDRPKRQHDVPQRHRRARRFARFRSSGIPGEPARWSSCTRTAWPPSGSWIVTKAWLISTLGWLPPCCTAISGVAATTSRS